MSVTDWIIKNKPVFVVGFSLIIISFIALNFSISKEFKEAEKAITKKAPAVKIAKKDQAPDKPHLPVINPANDPLAPVAKIKTAPPREENKFLKTEKIYEVPSRDAFLIQ